MPTDTIVCHDLHLRHTDTEGRSRVQLHRVWDSDRFIAARESEAAGLNAAVKGDEKRLAKVERITVEQYQKERA
jgi:hypothetical protein